MTGFPNKKNATMTATTMRTALFVLSFQNSMENMHHIAGIRERHVSVKGDVEVAMLDAIHGRQWQTRAAKCFENIIAKMDQVRLDTGRFQLCGNAIPIINE